MERKQAIDYLKLMNSLMNKGSNLEDKGAYEGYVKVLLDFEFNLMESVVDTLAKKTKFFPAISEICEVYEEVNRKVTENKKFETKIKECPICSGNGFITHKKIFKGKKDEDMPIEFMLYCSCEKGQAYKYDGTQLEKHKSEFYSEPIAKYYDVEQLKAESAFRKRGVIPPPDNIRAMLNKLKIRLGA